MAVWHRFSPNCPLNLQPRYTPPNTPDSSPIGIQEDVSDTTGLASMGNLPRKILMTANDMIFGVYQDWVHQNPRTHMDGGIEEGGKWQERWKNWFVWPTNAMMYRLSRSEIDFLGFFRRSLTEFGITNGRRRGSFFSVSYFEACQWGVCVEKYTWPDWLMTWPVEKRYLRQVGTGFLQGNGKSFRGVVRDPKPGTAS